MAICPKCGVTVETGGRCPLCHTAMPHNGSGDVAYPDYSALYLDGKRFTIKRLLTFLSVVAGALCLMINLLTFQIKDTPWSAIIIIAFALTWSIFLTIRTKRVNTAGKILLLYLVIAVGALLIDGFSGFRKWSTDYVIPFLTIGIILYTTLLASMGKRSYKEYLGYLIVTLFISVCPLLLFLLSFSDVLWPSVAALAYSLLTATGLFIFSDREFKTEVRKRLHY